MTGWQINIRCGGFWIFLLAAWVGCCTASAQDTAAQEAAHRATALAQLPPDAAKVLFGREITPRGAGTGDRRL